MRDYDELVKRLRSPVMWDDGEDCDACEMLQDDAADAIEELLAAVPHWISVRERMPEDGERVLVACDDGVVRLNTAHDRFFDGILTKGMSGFPRVAFISHWMPLPAPPKEDKP